MNQIQNRRERKINQCLYSIKNRVLDGQRDIVFEFKFKLIFLFRSLSL